ncbi:uncharacterized protein LOC113561482 [Ooceraea biroi]|uniref:uncharacterized protein LOC113561482 n=1 Tax=Ooceraea biroi TaxID=2015173 RepID=UPI000F091F07|nr:uncharacterized protein LOC113561482 [Ooceraea biroi]
MVVFGRTSRNIMERGLVVDTETIYPQESMKYLGVYLIVIFEGHFRLSDGSSKAAGLLAHIPPVDILAEGRAWGFQQLCVIKGTDYIVCPLEKTIRARIRKQVLDRLRERWKERLDEMTPQEPGFRCRQIILPVWQSWLDRSFGRTNYYLTQFLTGHGAFNAFLSRIGKRPSSSCPYCEVSNEDPTHVIFNCSVWQFYRGDLCPADEGTLAQDAQLVRRMLTNQQEWDQLAERVSTILMLREEDGCEEER